MAVNAADFDHMVSRSEAKLATAGKTLPVIDLSPDLCADFEFFRRHYFNAPASEVVRRALGLLIETRREQDTEFREALDRDRSARRNLKIVGRVQ